MDGIAKTSLLTAAMRAAESKLSEKEGRLFVDPFAESLAGEEGFTLLKKGIEAAGDQPAIAVRTSFMDQKIIKNLQAGVRQVVIFAAGMDTRAYRLNFPSAAKVFELDRKEVLDYKKVKLSNHKPKCEHHTIAIDLRDEWQGKLNQAGFDKSQKTLWLVEGLLMYLKEADVKLFFQRLSAVASSKDVLLFDILGKSLLESPYMKNQLEFLKSINAPWLFGMDDPETFMTSLGWNSIAIQPGEFCPTRWPFPVAPRHIPNIPRSFFVEAVKQ